MSKKIEYIISKYKKIYNSYNIFSLRSILIIICCKYCIFTNNKYNQWLNKFVICIVDKKNVPLWIFSHYHKINNKYYHKINNKNE